MEARTIFLGREIRTAQAIAELGGPFKWGVLDCYQFTAGVVYRVTGKDFRSLFMYESERQALRLLKARGGLSAIVRGVLGPPCMPLACRNGDPLIVVADQREMLGVRFQGCAIVKTAKGVKPITLSAAVRGWLL